MVIHHCSIAGLSLRCALSLGNELALRGLAQESWIIWSKISGLFTVSSHLLSMELYRFQLIQRQQKPPSHSKIRLTYVSAHKYRFFCRRCWRAQETHAKDQFTGVLVNSEQKMKMTNGDQLYNSCKYYKTKSKTNTVEMHLRIKQTRPVNM